MLCACELMEIISSLVHAVSLCNDAAQGYFTVVMVQERHNIISSITVRTVCAGEGQANTMHVASKTPWEELF